MLGKKRKIDLIVLHCSDSDKPSHDNIETIRKWHTERGFTGPDGIKGNEDDIGYHFLITKDGEVHNGRNVNSIGAHVKNHNSNSIGICLTGSKKFSADQFKTLKKLINQLLIEYQLDWFDIKLHNELDNKKTCPNFKMEDVLNG